MASQSPSSHGRTSPGCCTHGHRSHHRYRGGCHGYGSGCHRHGSGSHRHGSGCHHGRCRPATGRRSGPSDRGRHHGHRGGHGCCCCCHGCGCHGRRHRCGCHGGRCYNRGWTRSGSFARGRGCHGRAPTVAFPIDALGHGCQSSCQSRSNQIFQRVLDTPTSHVGRVIARQTSPAHFFFSDVFRQCVTVFLYLPRRKCNVTVV